MTAAKIRYPYGPLERICRSLSDLPASEWNRVEMARMIGFSCDAVDQWNNRGHLTPWVADQAAVALGLHPAMIWPEWWEHGLAEADEYDADPHVRKHDRARRAAKGWPRQEPPPARGEDRPELARKRAWRASLPPERREADNAAARERYRRRGGPDRQREYYAANRDQRRRYDRERRQDPAERERRRLYARAYYRENRERLVAEQRARDEANRAERKAS